jgi:hypothetical protein
MNAPIDLDKIHQPVTPCRYEADRKAFLQKKYGLKGLEFEGMATKPSEQTVADFVNDKEREQRQLANMKLAVGRTVYHGKPIKLWYEVTK